MVVVVVVVVVGNYHLLKVYNEMSNDRSLMMMMMMMTHDTDDERSRSPLLCCYNYALCKQTSQPTPAVANNRSTNMRERELMHKTKSQQTLLHTTTTTTELTKRYPIKRACSGPHDHRRHHHHYHYRRCVCLSLHKVIKQTGNTKSSVCSRGVLVVNNSSSSSFVFTRAPSNSR